MTDDRGLREPRWLQAPSFDDPSKTMLSLPEQIASKLVTGIIHGEYRPGQRLHEVTLAEAFDVSRGPVRDALRLLEREGLVQIEARRGTWVRSLTRKEVEDIFEVRAVLLALTAGEIARRPSREALEFLEQSGPAMRAAIDAGDGEKFLLQVYNFSMYLTNAADNHLARGILSSLGRQTLRLTRRALAEREHQMTWLNNWTVIVDGIRRHDSAAAERATRVLVNTVEAAVLAVFDRGEAEAAPYMVPPETNPTAVIDLEERRKA